MNKKLEKKKLQPAVVIVYDDSAGIDREVETRAEKSRRGVMLCADAKKLHNAKLTNQRHRV